MRFGWRFAALVAALPGATMLTHAASSCYEQSAYPAILRIEAIPGGLRAYGKSPDYDRASSAHSERLQREPWRRNDRGEAYTHPVISYGEQSGFSGETALTCYTGGECKVAPFPRPPPCPSGLPSGGQLVEDALRAEPSLVQKPLDHTISIEPSDNDVSQDYGACALRDGNVWFGISYYDGEGQTGIGGIGRYDPRTGRSELRRPRLLRHSSIDHLLHDGEQLWFGTVSHHECLGTPPTLGLVRYDWRAGRALTFLDENDGPCGLLVNGLLQLGDDVWVATDLGLSRWNRKTSKWQNYVPDPSANPPVRETTCPDLYRQLRETLPRSGWNEAMPASSPYHQLMETLARLRPRAIDAATLADSLFHVFFPEPTFDAGEGAYARGDFNAARQEIRERAEAGDIQAQYNLGTLYARGEGVSRDLVQAVSWLRKAAAQGHAQAQANLGLLLLNTARTKAEWLEAKRWLRQASAQDSHYARNAFLLIEHSRMPASLGD